MKNWITAIIFILLFPIIPAANNQNVLVCKEEGVSNENCKTITFEVGEGSFMVNGKPFIIKAAELHYPRIPREYWDQRIKMCKALGMNTICLYTFWNVHESVEGEYDFQGQNDIRAFIQLCQQNRMNVILRPGPYVCAEWEMGGLPWWVLKKKNIKLRDSDPYFIEKVKLFEKSLAAQISDLIVQKGGPIIMIQVENEYGSYGENKEYISEIRDALRTLYGKEIVMFQCDWSSNFTLNGLDDLVWTMNFGTGADIENQFSYLKELRPTSPLMCSEFWSGWFDKWGAAHETRPADEMIKGIEEMLSKNISFSLYMTHGGTNWGHWAGANSPGYAPDVTSYDYDAPIDESGNPTKKYWMLRDLLSKFADEESLPDLPELVVPIEIEKFTFTEYAPLWENLPGAVRSDSIKTMEEFDQGYGSMIYSTELPEIKDGATLRVKEAHDFAQVFINGEYIGKLDRRLGETELRIPPCGLGARLDILVEAMGRINFGVAIKDFKGITESVTVIEKDGKRTIGLTGWDVYLLPDVPNFYNSFKYKDIKSADRDASGRFPRGVYKGKFYVSKPSDTFLKFDTWGKGLVYVNGQGLGRIWDIGPQQTLYLPGVWLKPGENEILIFDIIGPREFVSAGVREPILNLLQGDAGGRHNSQDHLDLGNLSPIFGGSFPQGNGWKTQLFDHPVDGQYLVIEILSTIKENEMPSIAEFYILDAKGHRLSRESWKVKRVESEDSQSGNNTADKIFDLQESTFWKSAEDANFPIRIEIDLGKQETIGGIEYLPRVESGAPGAIKDYRIYISENPL